MIRIFQIGFNKCGTTTIHEYLLANGIKSLHWDKGRLAQHIFRNLANGDELLTGYEDFQAFTDMEFLDDAGTHHLEAYKLFPYFATQYPDGVFILNTRDREAWIRSRFSHFNNVSYPALWKSCYGIASDDDLADLWRAEWERHHRRVTEFFSGKSYRFFVCRIETDLPYLLNEKLPELELDDTKYKVIRDTSGKRVSRRAKLLRRHAKTLRRLGKSVLGDLLSTRTEKSP
jgi:hypothetical protein